MTDPDLREPAAAEPTGSGAPDARIGAGSLGFLITDVARLLRAGFEQRVAEAGLGVTSGEARALVHIVAAEGERQTAIAERMGVEPMTLCGYVDRLEKRGLVARRPHPEDGRAKQIAPTPAAAEIIARITPVARGNVEDAVAGLPPEDVEALRRILAHMRERLAARHRGRGE